MPIMLSDEEARTLAEALDAYLPELRFEMARTEREEAHRPLVLREERLTRLRRKLP